MLDRERTLVGMVHVAALPGTPRHDRDVAAIVGHAVDEAAALAQAGFDAIILENRHDVPYLRRTVGPEITAAMSVVTAAVTNAIDLPVGVQILAGANEAALAVAHAAGASFIRVEGFVYASVADEGLIDDADAGPLLRTRRRIGAERIAIFADIKKKHSSHAITADVDLAETAKAAAFFGADGLIVTGVSTGEPCDPEDAACARAAVKVPILVGSGVTPDNAKAILAHAHGLIVGSYCKRGGVWSEPLDPERVARIVKAVKG